MVKFSLCYCRPLSACNNMERSYIKPHSSSANGKLTFLCSGDRPGIRSTSRIDWKADSTAGLLDGTAGNNSLAAGGGAISEGTAGTNRVAAGGGGINLDIAPYSKLSVMPLAAKT